MKNTIIVAIDKCGVNNLNTLPPMFQHTPDDPVYVIHNSPALEVIYDDNEHNNPSVLTNYDYCVSVILQSEFTHNALADDKMISLVRLDKREQHAQFINFQKHHKTLLRMPKMHYKAINSQEVYPIHHGLNNISTNIKGKVIVKRVNGASGCEQLILPAYLLSSVLAKTNLTIAEVISEFPEVIASKDSDQDYKLFERPNDYIVNGFINNVVSEYRILVSGPDMYIRERIITDEGFPQASLKRGKRVTGSAVVYEQLHSLLPLDVVNALKEYLKFIKLPFGSIDLYKTKDGQYGIFEYSHQYAHHGADPAWISNIHQYALVHLIQNKEDYI